MEEQNVPLTQADINRLLAACDEIERSARAVKTVLMNVTRSERKPGGAPCGLAWAESHGGAQCGREYAVKVGGAQCGDQYDETGMVGSA